MALDGIPSMLQQSLELRGTCQLQQRRVFSHPECETQKRRGKRNLQLVSCRNMNGLVGDEMEEIMTRQ